MSGIRDIYTKISEIPIGTAKSRDLSQIKLVVNPENAPMRLLLPVTEGDMAFVAIGSLTNTSWQIRDLCLWQPVTAGSGIEQCAEDMVVYMELYLAAMRKNRNLVGANLTGIQIKLGTVTWVKTEWWAVDCRLTVDNVQQ